MKSITILINTKEDGKFLRIYDSVCGLNSDPAREIHRVFL
jgi:hypothetical protein